MLPLFFVNQKEFCRILGACEWQSSRTMRKLDNSQLFTLVHPRHARQTDRQTHRHHDSCRADVSAGWFTEEVWQHIHERVRARFAALVEHGVQPETSMCA